MFVFDHACGCVPSLSPSGLGLLSAVGPDHVGIGTDMDGISPPSSVAWDDYREWPSIGSALLARGHSREDVAKVLGGNFRRVFLEITAV